MLADHHDDVCRQLAGPVEHRFDGLDVSTTEEGASTSTTAWPASTAPSTDEVEAGDHTLVLLQLHAVDQPTPSLPLVFHRSGFGRSVGRPSA